ncbi:MAG: delta-class carbonic anhydrase [Acidobacteriota bacterium]|nr:delta-class carbonic anhydrase [Acidobacteriota bacterium]
MKPAFLLSALSLLILSCTPPEPQAQAEPAPQTEPEPAPVSGDGPQSPRDIDNPNGKNKSIFSLAPSPDVMNLCNIHFHVNAEHKAEDYSILAEGEPGGYKCGTPLTPQELQAPEGEICKGLKPGDTVEVHWVYSSCNVSPGKGLGSCLSDACSNPNLRVEAQVFILVNDPNALNFDDFRLGGQMNGYYQPKALPGGTGDPVRYLGSTTGPSFTAELGSPLQVSWSVRPQCAKLDINSLGEWCKDNVFQEDHAHGVRELVTDPKQLSEIK